RYPHRILLRRHPSGQYLPEMPGRGRTTDRGPLQYASVLLAAIAERTAERRNNGKAESRYPLQRRAGGKSDGQHSTETNQQKYRHTLGRPGSAALQRTTEPTRAMLS